VAGFRGVGALRVWKNLAALLALVCMAPVAHADDAPAFERDVLAEINYVRAHPREYAAQLREYRAWFRGRILFRPGDDNGVITNEGVAAVDEAIAFLEHQAPLSNLESGPLLMQAALDHAIDQGAAGATGHNSRDGLSPGERVKRRGGDIYVGESIYYGRGDAAQVVRSLIVDDGVPSRGHRALLFKADFRFAGVGCSVHARFGGMCVVDMSGTADGSPVLPEWARNVKGAQIFRMPGNVPREATASVR
jgi:uncharacterized protein YkwD